MRASRRLHDAAVNAATFVVSLVLCYAIGEVIFLRWVAPELPPYLRSHLPDLPDVTGQTSKRGDLPHDHIAVLGDSYAEGLGDWMLAQGRSPRQYSAAHVLHALTGTDVISLGRWGYGSAEAMVLKPARVYLDHRCMLLPTLELPRRILVFFYEGNDLHDNFAWAARRVPSAAGGEAHGAVARYLNDTYGAVEWWRCHSYFALTARDAFGLLRAQWRLPDGDAAQASAPPQGETPNRVLAAGGELSLPPLLPPLRHPEDRKGNLEGSLALVVFDEALAWLTSYFPHAAVTVVYIPSPAAVYRFADSTIATSKPVRGTKTAAEVYAESQSICEHIRSVALERGTGFIDPRPDLRDAAYGAPVHGPFDWDHFNERGYRALGTVLAHSHSAQRTDCRDWR
jgi:hypothetical protein